MRLLTRFANARNTPPSNTRLLLPGAYVLKETAVVRLSAHVLRTSGRLAGSRSARRQPAAPESVGVIARLLTFPSGYNSLAA